MDFVAWRDHVNTLAYLFVDCAAFSEHDIAAYQASNEGVPASLLASIRFLLE